jgi:hypothetical protein
VSFGDKIGYWYILFARGTQARMHHLLQDMSEESKEIERKRITEHESEENIQSLCRTELGKSGHPWARWRPLRIENLSDGISTLLDFSSENLTGGSVLGPLAGGRGDSVAAFECCLASAADAIAYQPQPSRCGLYMSNKFRHMKQTSSSALAHCGRR